MKRMIFLSVFSLLVSACGSSGVDGVDVAGTTGDSKTSSKSVFAVATGAPVPTTKAKVYMGFDDSYTVSNSGTTLYGGAGKDVITIANGVSGVNLDQNVEQIVFQAASSSYTFKQTGNKINVYDASGITLLMSVPVQGDADGTVFSFSDGSASALLLSGGVMKLGSETVSATKATAIIFSSTTTTTTTLNTPTTTLNTTTTTLNTTTTTTIPTGSVTVQW